jgi:trigger factor
VLNIEFSKDKLVDVVTVNVSKGDYEHVFLAKVKEYTKKLKVKGFRHGNVPVSVVKDMYGRGILFEELSKMAGDFLLKYIEDNSMSLISAPVFESADFDENFGFDSDYSFKYRLGIVGEFELKEVLNVEVDRYVVEEVGDAFLADYCDNLRLSYSTKHAAEVCSEHALVVGTLLLNESVKVSELRFHVYVDSLLDVGKGRFVGCRVGDVVRFSVRGLMGNSVALGSAVMHFRSMGLDESVEYDFLVDKIFELDRLEVNQGFFDRVSRSLNVGSVQSRSEFDEVLRMYLIEGKRKVCDEFLLLSIKNGVIANSSFELPYDFIKFFLKYDERVALDPGFSLYYEHYLKSLRWQCVYQRVVKEYGVEVSAEEVIESACDLFRVDSGGGVNETVNESVNEYVNESKVVEFLRVEKNYSGIYHKLMDKKVIEVIKGEVRVVDKVVKFEELDSIIYNVNL